MKAAEKIIRRRPSRKEMVEVYNEKGLNGLYAFLRKHNIKFEKEIHSFGLDNKGSRKEKAEFIDHKKLQFHYYSKLITSRKTGWSYNNIRAIKIVLL